MTLVESPLIAAVKCSESQLFAVPGSPISKSALSVTNVDTAISTSRSCPIYFGVISFPFTLPPQTYVFTDCGDIFHPVGIGFVSAAINASISS